MAARGGGEDRGGDVVDMDAVEHLAFADDAAGVAIRDVGQRVAAGAIDAAEPQHRHRAAGPLAELLPAGLGLDTAAARAAPWP